MQDLCAQRHRIGEEHLPRGGRGVQRLGLTARRTAAGVTERLDEGRVGFAGEVPAEQFRIGVPEQVEHHPGLGRGGDHGGSAVLDTLGFLLDEVEQGASATNSGEPTALDFLAAEQFVAQPSLLVQGVIACG